jgi:Xaa-Pro aminopeptidase
LYDFYLACYQAILQAIRPGVTASQIKQEAVRVMESALAQSKFSKPHYQTAAKNFVDSYREGANNPETYMGHWVGMATHDVGVHTGPLTAGMVFTIEPALRVPEEKIYIRLEDLIVITETGKEIISEFVPMDRAGIEKLMAEKGLLETYAPAQ